MLLEEHIGDNSGRGLEVQYFKETPSHMHRDIKIHDIFGGEEDYKQSVEAGAIRE